MLAVLWSAEVMVAVTDWMTARMVLPHSSCGTAWARTSSRVHRMATTPTRPLGPARECLPMIASIRLDPHRKGRRGAREMQLIEVVEGELLEVRLGSTVATAKCRSGCKRRTRELPLVLVWVWPTVALVVLVALAIVMGHRLYGREMPTSLQRILFTTSSRIPRCGTVDLREVRNPRTRTIITITALSAAAHPSSVVAEVVVVSFPRLTLAVASVDVPCHEMRLLLKGKPVTSLVVHRLLLDFRTNSCTRARGLAA